MEEEAKTKTCPQCKRTLPLDSFGMRMFGGEIDYNCRCRECQAKRNESQRRRYQKNKELGGGATQNTPTYSDAEFDGKEPRIAIDYLRRAALWLKSRGYDVEVNVEYTQTRKVLKI